MNALMITNKHTNRVGELKLIRINVVLILDLHRLWEFFASFTTYLGNFTVHIPWACSFTCTFTLQNRNAIFSLTADVNMVEVLTWKNSFIRSCYNKAFVHFM